jgi:hypothetical protein
VIEYDEDEEFDGDEAIGRRSSRKFKLSLGALLILLAGLATTVAANVTINNKGSTEFGQGLFTLKACDSWIGVTLVPSAITGGNYYVQNMKIYGLDAVACAGTNLQFQLFKTGQSTPLNIFTDSDGTANNRILLHIAQNASSTTRGQSITLINGAGVNFGYHDTYENINYDATTGVYTWTVYGNSTPLALMSDVNSVVVQSTSY